MSDTKTKVQEVQELKVVSATGGETFVEVPRGSNFLSLQKILEDQGFKNFSIVAMGDIVHDMGSPIPEEAKLVMIATNFAAAA